MKKLLKKKKLWRGVAVSSLSMAVIVSMVGEVAESYAASINYALKTSSYKVVEDKNDTSSSDYYPSDYESAEEVAAYGKEISEEVESEGLVLLKNKDSVLPLSSGDNVSTVLQTAYSFSYGSSGSGAIDATKYTDLKTALEDVGLNVNSTLWDFYKENPSEQAISYNRSGDAVYKVNALPWDSYSTDAQDSIGKTGGTAIVVIGRLGGEGADVSAKNSDGYDGSYLSLTAEEIDILARLTEMKQKGEIDGIVVMLNTAMAFETSFLDDNWSVNVDGNDYTIDVDACMWVGNVGIGGISAVAKTLVGDVVPSGKLSDTYVKDNFSSPAAASWILQNSSGSFASQYENSDILSSDAQKKYGVYTEGIYVGYRYYETRYEDVVLGRENTGDYEYANTVSRPFGYGLSYTEFSYDDYKVEENAEGNYDVTVTVTNTGDYAGKEVVEVYLQKPYTQYDMENGIEKASVELAGFEKTQVLEPGESETVTVTVDKENFKTYDANGYETYILEEGEYYLAVGTSAHDALNNILALKGKTTADGMDEEGNSSLAMLVGEDIKLDTETYAVSKETGNAITNQLEFADINKYEGAEDNSVTYVSRSDWEGTYPKEAITITVTEQMAEDLKSTKEIEENEEDEMPTYGAENGMALIMLRGEDYDSELWDDILDQMTWEDQSKLVMLSGYGSVGVEGISLPSISAEDGPTGVVDSQESISFPSEGIWASTFNRELIQKVGDALAEDARNAGVTGMYLPGVNLHRTPFGGRAHEYFSEDPFLSGEAVESEIKGLQAKGVTPYVKHFAFNDEEDSRIGISIWLNEQSARELYLKPFEYAVSPSKGNAHGVMSSFNRAGCIWTSASEELMENILRGEFGFDGIVLTDMALGQNAYMSYDAITKGTDLFLDPTGDQTQFDTYSESVTFRNKVREACHRYLYVIANYSAAVNGFSSSSEIVAVTPWWQMILIVLKIFFFAVGGVSTVLLYVSLYKERKEQECVVVVEK